MAQLSDDCFAFGGPLMPLDEMVEQLSARLEPVEGVENIPLAQADGRILAENILASFPLPPFNNSAVDGYAVRGDDLPLEGERGFTVSERLQAGSTAQAPVLPGETVRIFTGAPMPGGADTVFMQEDVRSDDAGRVILPPGLKRGANMRLAGEDVVAGQLVLAAGRRMRPQDVAIAAALGFAHVAVRRRLRVAVLSTGNEIVAPGGRRGLAQLFDSNRFMLMAMLARLGCEVSDLGMLGDDPVRIATGLKKAASGHDLILTTGGVSTGEADYVRESIESVGSLVFWRVAIKPGRPVAMGVIDGTPLIGLPGNPAASFVTFVCIARPALLALTGALPQKPLSISVRAAFSYKKKAGRREYVRATLKRASDGMSEAVKFPREGAGLLSSLVETDGLVELSEEATRVEPGQMVAFLPYSGLL